jgi:hypothetical protein
MNPTVWVGGSCAADHLLIREAAERGSSLTLGIIQQNPRIISGNNSC